MPLGFRQNQKNCQKILWSKWSETNVGIETFDGKDLLWISNVFFKFVFIVNIQPAINKTEESVVFFF